jgi:molecular chaperone DnaJ
VVSLPRARKQHLPVDLDDAYAELGLSRDAAEAEIKAAWRRLVSRWHPDRNPSELAVVRMQRLNLALDLIRMAGFAAGQAMPAAAEEEPDGPDSPPAHATTPVRTVYRRLKLSLEEAALGCTRVFSGRSIDPCAACEGTGRRIPGSACRACAGAGAQRAPLWYGLFSADIECTACRGSGVLHEDCPACAGQGQSAPRAWRVAARIPPGVRSSDVLGVDGKPSRGGQAAMHLELRIDLQPHPLFTLDDDGTVRCRVPVDGFLWVAQRPVEVPTLDGLHTLALQPGQLGYRLPGLGFPVQRRGARGDALVEIEPVFPAHLSADQQILLDQLIAGTGRGPADPRLAAWQQEMKRWQRGQNRP